MRWFFLLFFFSFLVASPVNRFGWMRLAVVHLINLFRWQPDITLIPNSEVLYGFFFCCCFLTFKKTFHILSVSWHL